MYFTPPEDDPPVAVTMTSPVAGGTFQLGQTISISGRAFVAAGRSLVNVLAFAGPDLIGASNSAWFTIPFTPTRSGTYDVTIIALDDLGMTTVSTVSITVPAVYGNNATFAGLLQSDDPYIGGGLVKLTSLGTGAFSVKVLLDGVSHGFSGVFQSDGSYAKTIQSGGTKLRIGLQYVFAAPGTQSDRIDVSVTRRKENPFASGNGTFLGSAERVESSLSETVPAGIYTLLFPPDQYASVLDMTPAGYGYAVMKVDPSGSYWLGGALADNTPLSLRGNLTRNATLPIYLPRARGAGVFLGTMRFRDIPGTSDLDGTLRWSRPSHSGSLYPDGFDDDVAAIGSRYQAPADGQLILPLANGSNEFQVLLDGDDVGDREIAFGFLRPSSTTGAAEGVTLDTYGLGRGTVSFSPVSLPVKFNPLHGPGLFSGTFIDLILKRRISYKGVVFQKQNFGAGFFVGKHTTGEAVLGPPIDYAYAEAKGLPVAIPLNDDSGASSTVSIASKGRIVSIDLGFRISAGAHDHVVVTLTSPSGTATTVYDSQADTLFNGTIFEYYSKLLDFNGESANGAWTLSVTDQTVDSSSPTLDSWTLSTDSE